MKRRYAKKVPDLRSVAGILQNRIPFEKGEKIGESYQVGVMLRPPQGFTYSGSSGAAATLNAQRNAVTKQASVVGSELNLIERVTLKALASAVEKGEQALGVLLDEVVAGMKKSAMNRVEGSLLRGQYPYGIVESVVDLGGSLATITFTAATWSPGLFWFFGENSTWDVHTAVGGARVNTNGAMVLTKINSATRTITVSYTTALQAVATHLWFPNGANGVTLGECLGLIAQARNLMTSQLGIDPTVYNNWAGNQYAVTGEFSLGVMEDAFAQLRDRGATGKLTAFVSNRAWSRLSTDLQAARYMDQSYSPEKNKAGQRSMSYFTADIDEVEFVRHPFLAWGEVLILPEDEVQRIGSSDVTFGIPGMKEDLMVLVPGTNTVELQAYSDQAPIIKKPNFAMLMTGITF